MSGVNPQGCEISSFKVPSAEDLDHDYLWRYMKRLPERGRIGIFNRSYYEEVLVVRVHKEVLAREKLSLSLVTKSIWEERYEDIRNTERYLARNGYVICKFFLHLSKKEQKSGSCNDWTMPPRIGSFPLPTSRSEAIGMTMPKRTRT